MTLVILNNSNSKLRLPVTPPGGPAARSACGNTTRSYPKFLTLPKSLGNQILRRKKFQDFNCQP